MSQQPPLPEPAQGTPAPATDVVDRAFGAENRARLLGEYFTRGPGAGADLSTDTAWQHVYRLLLWIDRTTNLAHCYESDKCQPGRAWYARSLAFHAWLADALGVAPGQVDGQIDTLFKQVTRDLAAAAAARLRAREAAAARQREPYSGRELPRPGDDPQLEAIVTETLAPYLASDPPPEVLRTLTERIQGYATQENKRKNLVGEGFEDTLAALLDRVPGIADRFDIRVRSELHELPGFYPPRGQEKPKVVDLALLGRSTGRRVLVTCKWSVRSDREEQFYNDFRIYTELEADGRDFDYVLATNEFDPARLAAACEARRQNAELFSDVVHVNTEGPRAAYAAPTAGRPSRGITRAREHIEAGRLASLRDWLAALASTE